MGPQASLTAERIEADRWNRDFPDIPPIHERRSGSPGSQRIHGAIPCIDQEELLLGIYIRDRLGNDRPLREFITRSVPFQNR